VSIPATWINVGNIEKRLVLILLVLVLTHPLKKKKNTCSYATFKVIRACMFITLSVLDVTSTTNMYTKDNSPVDPGQMINVGVDPRIRGTGQPRKRLNFISQ